MVEQELQHLLARGGVIGGTSAGAAIQSRTMIAGGNPVPRIARGFDLFPGTVIDQHFLARNRQPRLVHAVAEHPPVLGVGVDESTALVVQGCQMNVLGRSSVTLALAAAGDFAEKTVTLKAGETADLVAWQQKVRKRREEVTAEEEPHADGTRPPRR